MFLSLASPMASRDGTLTKDAKLMNCFVEADPTGKRTVVKRPGLVLNASSPAAAAQGVATFGTIPWAILQDTLYDLGGGGHPSMALPSVTTPGQLMVSLDILTSAGAHVMAVASASGLWHSENGTSISKVTAADYPSATVPGLVYLDGTFYVMTTSGAIQGSAIEDISSWNALNFLSTDRGIGTAVALSRHLNYVVAFCDSGVQFFYDAANAAPGSPLSPSGNTLTTIGCASATSIQGISELTVFVSKSPQRGRSVSALSGTGVVHLSNPVIDRILNLSASLPIRSCAFKVGGHSFYILTVVDLGLTLALDLTTGDWAQWSSSPDGLSDLPFDAAYYVKGVGSPVPSDLLLAVSSGKSYKILPTAYDDAGAPIRAFIRTQILEHQTVSRKFLPVVNLIADTVSATVGLRYSDDDYQTFSAYRQVNLGTVRKQLRRLGSFRRRSFDLLHVAATPFRIEAVEIPDTSAPTLEQP